MSPDHEDRLERMAYRAESERQKADDRATEGRTRFRCAGCGGWRVFGRLCPECGSAKMKEMR